VIKYQGFEFVIIYVMAVYLNPTGFCFHRKNYNVKDKLESIGA